MKVSLSTAVSKRLYTLVLSRSDFKKEDLKMAIDKSLISGSTTMLILRLLENKDMYGYEMIENLEKKSENIFTLKAGTLYPLLHSL